MIAGSYTPYSLVAIGGAWGWTLFGLIWGLTIFGIIYYIFNRGKHVILDTILYVAMGWLVILSGSYLYVRLSPTGFWLLVSGGIAYTIGAILFSMRNVPLYPYYLAFICYARFNLNVLFRFTLCLKNVAVEFCYIFLSIQL